MSAIRLFRSLHTRSAVAGARSVAMTQPQPHGQRLQIANAAFSTLAGLTLPQQIELEERKAAIAETAAVAADARSTAKAMRKAESRTATHKEKLALIEAQRALIADQIALAAAQKGSSNAVGSPEWPAVVDSGDRCLQMNIRQRVGFGTSSFPVLRNNNCYYIDKSELIADVLASCSTATLVLRPRRSGKSLSASMCSSFFAAGADRALFRGLAIDEHTDIISKHLGQHPCIHFSLSSCTARDYEHQLQQFAAVIADVYAEHRHMIFPHIDHTQQQDYNTIQEKQASLPLLQSSLRVLSSHYFQLYARQCIIICDEYDAGMQAAMIACLEQPSSAQAAHTHTVAAASAAAILTQYQLLYGSFFAHSLQDNSSLYRGLLFGVSRVVNAGSLSITNSIDVAAMHSELFSKRFGLSEAEVDRIYSDHQSSLDRDQLRVMYSGYTAGSTQLLQLYNPYSVLTAIRSNSIEGHWAATGTLEFMHLFAAPENNMLRNKLSALMCNGSIAGVDLQQDSIIPPDRIAQPDRVLSSLYYSGYLARDPNGVTLDAHGNTQVELRIPNDEIKQEMQRLLLVMYSDALKRY